MKNSGIPQNQWWDSTQAREKDAARAYDERARPYGRPVNFGADGRPTAPPPPRALNWACAACTLENAPDRRRCAACGSSRGSRSRSPPPPRAPLVLVATPERGVVRRGDAGPPEAAPRGAPGGPLTVVIRNAATPTSPAGRLRCEAPPLALPPPATKRPRVAGRDRRCRVDARVTIWWGGDESWYPGTLAAYVAATDEFRVEYDDGAVELIRLAALPWPPNAPPPPVDVGADDLHYYRLEPPDARRTHWITTEI